MNRNNWPPEQREVRQAPGRKINLRPRRPRYRRRPSPPASANGPRTLTAAQREPPGGPSPGPAGLVGGSSLGRRAPRVSASTPGEISEVENHSARLDQQDQPGQRCAAHASSVADETPLSVWSTVTPLRGSPVPFHSNRQLRARRSLRVMPVGLLIMAEVDGLFARSRRSQGENAMARRERLGRATSCRRSTTTATTPGESDEASAPDVPPGHHFRRRQPPVLAAGQRRPRRDRCRSSVMRVGSGHGFLRTDLAAPAGSGPPR